MIRRLKRGLQIGLVVWTVALIFLALPAVSQTVTGAITGEVTDLPFMRKSPTNSRFWVQQWVQNPHALPTSIEPSLLARLISSWVMTCS
jgi:hypothetical protein